jgi:hypothetical protein
MDGNKIMHKTKRILLHLFIGTLTCLLLISGSAFSTDRQVFALIFNPAVFQPLNQANLLNSDAALAFDLEAPPIASPSIATQSITSQPIAPQATTAEKIAASIYQAETEMAQAGAGGSSQAVTRYVAVLRRSEIVPTAPTTSAFGAAGAVLRGDRLIVRGDFSNLTSSLRDYATDPLDPPNPNITSAVHIHQGQPTENGPFQYALTVTPSTNDRTGRFSGEYTLTPDQIQALSAGLLYVDIHTTRNRGGELRGVFQPY